MRNILERIADGEVILQKEGNLETLTGIDMVVSAWITAPVNRLAEEIALDGSVAEVYTIGDAVRPRDASDAIYEGAIIGRKI